MLEALLVGLIVLAAALYATWTLLPAAVRLRLALRVGNWGRRPGRAGWLQRVSTAVETYPGKVAERWRYADGAGEIGVIASVTQAFCRACNRLRLSAEGSLYTCLFAEQGHDLKWLLRHGGSDEELVNEIAAVWRARGDRYSEIRTAETAKARKVEMSYIGG